MSLTHVVWTVDSHTMGEPTRVVVGGFPIAKGLTVAEKKAYLQENYDYLRTALMHEPRGHNDMFGAIIVPPSEPTADLGLIFMDSGGYLNMCGHGTIGAVTVAIETGLLPAKGPVSEYCIETPAGLVLVQAEVKNGKAGKVTFQNVPAFVYATGLVVEIPSMGSVSVDIAFGGSFFAIVPADALGVRIVPEAGPQLVDIALALRLAVNETVRVKHPLLSHINRVDLVEIYAEPTHPEAHCKNVVVFGAGSIDRSPCGTGTCAKMALLHHRGELGIGERFVHESIIGTLFEGRLVGKTRVGDYEAVIPEISGQAFITGYHKFVIDPEDPLKYGFRIG